MTGGFHAQKANNVKSVSMSWRQYEAAPHVTLCTRVILWQAFLFMRKEPDIRRKIMTSLEQ